MLVRLVRLQSGQEEPMSAFAFRLEQVDGTPADPPMVKVSVPNWSPGDTIALGAGRSLRVAQVRQDDPEENPTLIVVDDTGGKDVS
jgi:hypothetical protein